MFQGCFRFEFLLTDCVLQVLDLLDEVVLLSVEVHYHTVSFFQLGDQDLFEF